MIYFVLSSQCPCDRQNLVYYGVFFKSWFCILFFCAIKPKKLFQTFNNLTNQKMNRKKNLQKCQKTYVWSFILPISLNRVLPVHKLFGRTPFKNFTPCWRQCPSLQAVRVSWRQWSSTRVTRRKCSSAVENLQRYTSSRQTTDDWTTRCAPYLCLERPTTTAASTPPASPPSG